MKRILNSIKEISNVISPNKWLTVCFSQPILLFLLPRTYYRLFKNVFNPFDKFVTGFSSHMAIILPWYFRIDECVKKYGRNGYVFEDGMGFSLKERFWLNPISLRIYNNLRIQKYALLGVALIVLFFLFIGTLAGDSILMLFFLVVLFCASPLFLIPFFRLAKPESLSWVFVMPAVYSFLMGNYFFCAFFLVVLALLNFTVTLLIFETVVFLSLITGKFSGAIISLTFPSIILLFDVVPFLRNSFASGLLECLGGRKPRTRSENFLRIRPHDIYLIFFYLIFISAFIASKAPLIYPAVLLNSLVLFVINRNVFRFADSDTFFRLFFILSTFFLVLFFNPLVFIAYVIFIYFCPLSIMESVENVIREYPHLKPYSTRKAYDFFSAFASRIPKQSRIILESESIEKSFSGFVEMFYYLDYVFLKRGIEFLPMEWVRVLKTDYFLDEYVRLNKEADKKTIEEKCIELGANYIMAYSDRFKNNLKSWGYKQVDILKTADASMIFWNYEKLGKNSREGKDLYLFEIPYPNGIIYPMAPILRKPNYIEFEAKANTSYTIKYNYHPLWKAFQNGKSIAIKKTKDKLAFMSLKSGSSGIIELKYGK